MFIGGKDICFLARGGGGIGRIRSLELETVERVSSLMLLQKEFSLSDKDTLNELFV